MRRAHYLKSNKSQERPARLIFFDVETRLERVNSRVTKHHFRYGYALHWRRRERHQEESVEPFEIISPFSFWDWVEAKARTKSRLILTSHNLSVDMTVLQAFTELPQRGYKLRSLYLSGHTKIICFKRGGRKLLFLDNANWWRVPLATLGKMVGLPKLDTDPLTAADEELKVYCQRDTEILLATWRRWFEFLDEHDLGNWAITVSSQALTAYTHRFMSCPIAVHNREYATTLERASYHGGRCEAFRLGEFNTGNFYKLDVNSMYPFVMRNNLFPSRLVGFDWHPTIAKLQRTLEGYLVIAEVLVETTEPVFPLVTPQGVIYPVGSFRTTLCTPDLQYAVERGMIRRVYLMAIYQGDELFRDYVDYLYPLKLRYESEGNTVYRECVKLLLNSLYGKFGQLGIKETVIGACSPERVEVVPLYNLATGKRGYHIYLAGQIIEQEEDGESWNSVVSIASHVTAYARMYLWRLMKDAGLSNTYYCDTDSLIVCEHGYHNLRHLCGDHNLGGLKLEGCTDCLAIHGKKDYEFAGGRTLKGVPHTARKVAPDTWEFEMWPTLRGMLHGGDIDHYYTITMTRRMKHLLTWATDNGDGVLEPLKLRYTPSLPVSSGDRLAELEIEIGSLEATLEFPSKLIFTLWDWREGQLRKGADDLYTAPKYRGIPLDMVAMEHGYDDYNRFLVAIERQVKTYQRLRRLRAEYAQLRRAERSLAPFRNAPLRQFP